MTKLLDYYKGQHDILFRVLSDPTKPNNKVVANYCGLIADFYNSYLLGVPIKYSSQNEPMLEEIHAIFNYNDEAGHNITVGENMNIFGYGVEILYIDDDKQIRFTNIDPRETIFIYAKDIEGELETCIRYFALTEEEYTVEVYDYSYISTYTMNKSFTELTQTSKEPHSFGLVPLVQYANNQVLQGSFEGVMDLQDALNKLLSDELNDYEQFVDAYLVLTGLQDTTKQELAKMREDRAILIDGEAKAEWLIKNVNNDHIRELKEDITSRIYNISKTPKTEEFATLGSGVAIKYKMLATETQAKKQERYFKKGLQRRIELITNILKLRNPALNDYKDINMTFHRNFIIDNNDERKAAIEEMAMNIISKIEYRMRFHNETFDEAKKALERVREYNIKISDEEAEKAYDRKFNRIDEVEVERKLNEMFGRTGSFFDD